MNRNKEVYKEFAQRFAQLKDSTHAYYVEGERQTSTEDQNVYEFRCNVSPEEQSSEIVYTVEVCIYCESVSDNIYAVQDMFDKIAPLFADFPTSIGCAQRDCRIKNRFFGRAGTTTPVVIGTSEAIFTITINKE